MIKFSGDDFRRKLLKAAQKAITKRLKGVRCPVHGKKAKVTPKMSGTKMSWDISGCCEELEGMVKAALK